MSLSQQDLPNYIYVACGGMPEVNGIYARIYSNKWRLLVNGTAPPVEYVITFSTTTNKFSLYSVSSGLSSQIYDPPQYDSATLALILYQSDRLISTMAWTTIGGAGQPVKVYTVPNRLSALPLIVTGSTTPALNGVYGYNSSSDTYLHSSGLYAIVPYYGTNNFWSIRLVSNTTVLYTSEIDSLSYAMPLTDGFQNYFTEVGGDNYTDLSIVFDNFALCSETLILDTRFGNYSSYRMENDGPNTIVGWFPFMSQNGNWSHSLVNGLGDTDNSKFHIFTASVNPVAYGNNQLRSNENLDFETQMNYSVRVRITDPFGDSVDNIYTFSIGDINENLTAVTLTSVTATLPDNTSTATRIKVADINVTDDALGTNAITLSGTDAASFEVGNATLTGGGSTVLYLKAGVVLNWDRFPYIVNIEVNDETMTGSFTQTYSLTVTNGSPNQAPTDIALSASSITENAGANALVGTISTTDPDAGNTFTYTLVTGTGDTDNNSFNINGNQLRATANLNFQTKSSYSVRIRSTDQDNLSIDKIFTIINISYSENTANFNNCADWNSQNGNVTTVGSNGGPSYYGTFDQTGSVLEWNSLTNTTSPSRGLRGGRWNFVLSTLVTRYTISPASEFNYIGFRLASSPTILGPPNPLGLDNFVTVGDINNNNDTMGSSNTLGFGAISYNYQIGKYLVTNCEYVEFLNAIATTDNYGVYTVNMAVDPRGGINRNGSVGSYIYSVKSNMGNKPVVFVNWFDAARYCNWLHNNKPTGLQAISTTERGVYLLDGIVNGNAVPHTVGAKYHIPTENEWYKAAYYSPTKGGGSPGYYLYATQSDDEPACVTANNFGDGSARVSDYACPSTPTLNRPPTDIALSSSSIAENAGSNAVVGTLSTTDPDASNTFTYTLVTGTGDTDNNSFNISGDQLRATASFNFETKSSYSVRVRSTDQGGLFTEKAFTITATNVNETPTDIALSASSITENAGADAVVGTLSTTDPDAGNTFTYTLVTGTGSTDNDAFNISESQLQATASLNFETKSSYSVRVRSTDQGGLFTEKVFTIIVTNVNETPTDIVLSASSIAENAGADAVVGTLSTTTDPPDVIQTFNITNNGTGNYVINGAANPTLTLSVGQTYTFNIIAVGHPFWIKTTQTTSAGDAYNIGITNNGTTDGTITFVVPSNAPTLLYYNCQLHSSMKGVMNIVASSFTYSMVTGLGSTDNAVFNISGNQLRATSSFDFETNSSYSVRIRSTYQGLLFTEKAFIISVTNIDENIVNLNRACVRKSNNQYYISFRNNKPYVFLNNKDNKNVFYKIKSTPSSRGYALDHKIDYNLEPDDTLYFLHSELGDGNFEVKVFAFFTGAPPIAHINEPSGPVFAGQFFIQPNIHEVNSVSAQAGTVTAEIINAINNLQSINDGYTDSYEPKTFYDYNPNALGYFVELQIMVNSTPVMVGSSYPSGPLAGLPGQFFRWAGTIIDQQTTLQNGIIIARKINP